MKRVHITLSAMLLILASGCSVASVKSVNYKLETVSSELAKIVNVNISSAEDKAIIIGELRHNTLRPDNLPGHIHIQILNAAGKVVKQLDSEYRREGKLNKKSRSFVFYVDTKTALDKNSTVRVIHHATVLKEQHLCPACMLESEK